MLIAVIISGRKDSEFDLVCELAMLKLADDQRGNRRSSS